MDTVKFDIALSRYRPNHQGSVPSISGSPSPNDPSSPTGPKPAITVDGQNANERQVPSPSSTSCLERAVLCNPAEQREMLPTSNLGDKESVSLSERFHNWMEMDLEHGL